MNETLSLLFEGQLVKHSDLLSVCKQAQEGLLGRSERKQGISNSHKQLHLYLYLSLSLFHRVQGLRFAALDAFRGTYSITFAEDEILLQETIPRGKNALGRAESKFPHLQRCSCSPNHTFPIREHNLVL